MIVELLVPICGPEGSFQIGDSPDLSEKLAMALVKDGHAKVVIDEIKAEIITEEKPEEPKLEEIKPELKKQVRKAVSSK